VAFIREVLIREDRQILHLFNNKAIINGLRAAKGLPVKVLTYRGYTGNIHWWDPTNYLTHLHPRVAAITCVSDAVKEVFDRQLFFPRGKAVTVSKGHQASWYADVKTANLTEFKLPERAVVVSVVANARRMKGIPYLIDALTLLPKDNPAHFLLIGRGLDSAETIAVLEQKGVRERVTFAGFRKDVLGLVKACDLSLLPSVKGEGLSKVLLESLFLGNATIMTDIGGNRGLAVHNESGIIIPPRDPEAMAEAIQLLVSNAALRARIGKAGKAYVSEHYTVDRSVQELKAVYEGVLS
jgi:glycosyltransferase involved in cell wall biosynthesis